MAKSRLTWTNADAQVALGRYEESVRMLARRLAPIARFGQALDEEDLCAEGRIAVLEALGSYEGFGIEERTWVRTRIRQRMIDAIRRLDVRSRDEMRHAMLPPGAPDMDAERVRAARARRLVSIDASHAESEPLSAQLYDTQAPPADELANTSAEAHKLVTAIALLPPRQRVAIELSLFEGLPLREIGDRMGISESRVCQLQKRAVQHLQDVFETRAYDGLVF